MSPRRSPSAPSLFVAVIAASAPGLLACGSRTAVLEEQGGSSESGTPDAGTGVEDSGGGVPDATTDTGAADAGTCPAGDSLCSGACVDEQTDLANCGGCGVACAGTCTGGRCLVTLASWLDGPTAMALDATHVYFTTGFGGTSGEGALMKVPIGGGTAVTLAVPGYPYNFDDKPLAVDGASVYRMTFGGATGPRSILRVPVGGGMATTLATPAPANDLVDFAVVGNQLYWTQDSQVLSARLNGGAPVTVVADAGAPLAVAADKTHVYWVQYVGPNGAQNPVLSAPAAGGTVSTLATGCVGRGSSSFGVDATSIYCSSMLGAMTVPRTGGAPTIYPSPGAETVVATDDASVYWAGADQVSDNLGIFKAPRGGGTVVTLAAGPFQVTSLAVTGLAVDATSVYWTSYDSGADGGVSGRVMKLTPK